MRIRYLLVLFSLLLPCMTWAADWQVYMHGAQVELAIDRTSVHVERGGLVAFTTREVYSEQKYEKPLKVYFYTRRSQVVVDCHKQLFSFIATDYLGRDGKTVWATMFPLPETARTYHEVPENSLASAMVETACELAGLPINQDEN